MEDPARQPLALRLRALIPEGRSLPEDVWATRHRWICRVVYAHAPALFVFGLIRGYGVLHVGAECSILVVAGLAATNRSRFSVIRGRLFRSGVATFGLVTASALLVHLSGGTVEAHFHFFAVLAVITLYQDWAPFLLALGFVVLHHGLMGALAARSVYNHPAAIAHPWRWAAIHAAFVLLASVANVVAWRLNEVARAHAKLVLDSAGEGIFGFDLDGTITFANRAASAMLGVDDLVGVPVSSLPSAGLRRAVDRFAAEHRASTGAATIGDNVLIDFMCAPMEERRRLTGGVVTFRDVTQRAQAEDDRERTLATLSATLESTADGILVVDVGGKITSFNARFVQMWGIPQDIVDRADDDEAIGFVLDQLEDPEGFVRKVRELYAEPDADSFDELHFKDGRVFERYSKPQKIGGRTIGRVWSFRDVTERNRLDDLKNSFLSAVSHELRTPLTSVLGFALTLERQGDVMDADDRREVIARLAQNASKLQRLLEDTLDLDRLSRGMLEPRRSFTALPALIARMVEESEIASMHEVSIDVEPVMASIDAPKVERIVENLLRNARRHTSPSTRVWVRAHRVADGILIAVDDEGAGVPNDVKESIFLPFQQGPGITRHAPGVGIGLALVARFAELHGGRAWVEDRPEGGASFRVSIPCETADQPLAPPAVA